MTARGLDTKMNLSLELTLTAADLRQLTAANGSRRFARILALIHILLAVAMLFIGFRHLSDFGLDWIFASQVVFAVYVVSQRFISEWLLLPAILRFSTQPPTYRMSIDDQSILIEQGKYYPRKIPWTSFAKTGTAGEFENHFWLECGRGNVWIPKRAFSTADDMTAFRAFLKDKMGERCQFNQ